MKFSFKEGGGGEGHCEEDGGLGPLSEFSGSAPEDGGQNIKDSFVGVCIEVPRF